MRLIIHPQKAAAERTYSVWYLEDLTGATWQTLADVVAGPARTVVLTGPTPGAQRYYLLVTPRSAPPPGN